MSNNHVSCTSDGPGHLYSYGNPTRVPQDATTRLASVTNVGDEWLQLAGPDGVQSRWWHHDAPQISTAAAGQAGWLRVDPSGAGVLLVAEPDRMGGDTWLLAPSDEVVRCRWAPDRSGWVWVVVGMLAVGLLVSWAAVDGSPDTSPGMFALLLAGFVAPLGWLATRMGSKEFRTVPFWVVYVVGAYLLFTGMWAVQWAVGPQSSPPPYEGQEDAACDMFGCQ